jgi:glycosyltransferase involved in cell wall biosynthesis
MNDIGLEAAYAELKGKRVCIVSRCARTLYNFRRHLIDDIARAGASVTALGAAGDGFEARLREHGVAFEHIPVAQRSIDPIADLRLVRHLVARFRVERPHVVHMFTIKPAIFGTLAAWVARVPVRIVTITGVGHAFTTAGFAVRTIVSMLYRVALSKAHVVCFQNADDRELFVSLGLVRKERTQLVPGSGIDLERFRPRPLPHAAGGAPHFLMIGRVLKEKGVAEFAAAAAIVKAKHPQATFTLLGGVDARNPSTLSSAELEALRRSSALQWIDDVADVRPYIEAADVVVLPSYREGLPRALLEGAAMARALVATDVPGCRDLVLEGQTGHLAEVGNAQSLAGAMQKLCDDPQAIAPMGRAARSLVESRFDLRLVNRMSLETYAGNLRTHPPFKS